ncbi:hypothetical protein [Kaarinaea lacus]
MKYKIKHSILMLLTIFTITACSGGGGGDTQPPADSRVNGAAVKGIIKGALIQVFKIQDGQIASQPSVTTQTGNDGSYEFTLSGDYSGPVYIVLSDNDQNSATMTCDSAAGCDGGYSFGEDMPLGDVELTAVIHNVTGGSIRTAAVTPYTHMAAAYAQQLGFTSENIAAANSKVGNMLGINNIVTSIPPDITNLSEESLDSNAIKYALMSAAVAAIAQQQETATTNTVIQALAASYTNNNGELLYFESVDDPATISLAEILSNSLAQAESANITNKALSSVQNELTNLLSIAESQDADQPTSTVASPTSGSSDLEIVKAAVSDVRTWGHVIIDDMESKTSVFQQQVDMAEVTLNTAGPLLANAFFDGVVAAIDAYKNGQNIDDLNVYYPSAPNDTTPNSGNVIVNGTTVTVNGVIDDVTLILIMQFPSHNNGVLVGTEFSVSISDSFAENDNIRVDIASGTLTVTYAQETTMTPVINGASVDGLIQPDSGSLQLTGVEMDERGVDNPMSFSGGLNLDIRGAQDAQGNVIRDVRGEVVYYNPASVSLSGEFSNQTNSIEMNIAASMENASTFMPNDYFMEDIGSYAFSNGGNTLTVDSPIESRTYHYVTDSMSPDYQKVVISFQFGGFDAGSDTSVNTYASLAAFLDSGHYSLNELYYYVDVNPELWYGQTYRVPLPTQASDWNLNGDTLDGIRDGMDITPDEDVNNFRQITNVDINFTAQLNGLPQAQFSLIGNRTGFQDGSGSINISYDGKQITAEGDVENDKLTSLRVTNQDGVEIVYSKSADQQNGVVTYNGAEVARIEEANNLIIIRYADGYFETL